MKKIFIVAAVLSAPLFINGRDCKGGTCCPSQKTCNPVQKIATESCNTASNNNKVETKEIIQQAYSTVVKESGFVCEGGGCCGGGSDLSQQIGYTQQELEMFADANLGLGCGHPVSLGYIKEGDIVIDLGSGAGLDCFLAACKVGRTGKVIGVDMTQEMINKARANAQKYTMSNVEFRLGDIEALPVDSNSVDVIMSNCVINLAPNKKQVFKEAHRVLKSGGKMAVSDVVLLNQLTDAQRKDPKLLCACVSGAVLKEDYLGMLQQVGFEVTIIDEDKDINKKWFGNDELPISSLKFIAYKK